MSGPLAFTVILVLVVPVILALRSSARRAARRREEAEPWLSEARRAGFALADAVNAAGDVEAAARRAAEAALAACRDASGDPGLEGLGRAAARAHAAAEEATALARRIRSHDAEIASAAARSTLGGELMNLAGSEAMEYRPYAADTAAGLDEVAAEARRAAAEATARASGSPR